MDRQPPKHPKDEAESHLRTLSRIAQRNARTGRTRWYSEDHEDINSMLDRWEMSR